MNPFDLLVQCEADGVKVRLIDDQIKLLGKPDAVESARYRLQPYKLQILMMLQNQHSGDDARQADDLLDQFELNLVETDRDPDELARVNNLCFHLVSMKGWTFERAMNAAANWVAFNPPHPDETGFVDVLALRRTRQ